MPYASPQETAILDEAGVPAEKRWSWDRVSKPQGKRTFASADEWQRWLISYLREHAEEAALGNVEGPLKAALDVLRDLRNEVRLVVDHGGLGGVSRRDHLDGWYTPFNAFLSIGPPLQRIEQMVALMEAGVLEVLGPRPEARACAGGWLVRSPLVPGEPVRVTTLVEARLPEPNLARTADELLSHLLRTSQCRSHTLDGYDTGGLDVTESPHHIIDALGRPHPRRFAVGVPTEGVHWVTAAGIRPGVNSVTLQDNDAMARAALRVAVTEVDESDAAMGVYVPAQLETRPILEVASAVLQQAVPLERSMPSFLQPATNGGVKA